MNAKSLKTVFSIIKKFTKKNSPAVLSGVAMVGVVATAIAAYKAAPVAQKIVEEKKKELDLTKPSDKSAKRAVVKEAVKEIVPVMAPPVLMGTVTIGCIFGSHSVSNRRIAALSAAYSISQNSLKDLTAKMNEMLGVKKTQSIKDAVTKDHLRSTPPPKEEQIIVTGDGTCLCKDMYSGRYFYSNADRIGKAIAWASSEARSSMYVCLNDFYDQLGLQSIPLGEDLGWNVDDLIGGTLPITYTAILTEDDRPCLCVEYGTGIRNDYTRLM